MASVVLEPERLSPGSNHLYCPSYKVHLPAEGVKSSISFPFTLIFAMVSSYPNAASLFSFAGMMVTDRFGVTADETERARSVEHTYIGNEWKGIAVVEADGMRYTVDTYSASGGAVRFSLPASGLGQALRAAGIAVAAFFATLLVLLGGADWF